MIGTRVGRYRVEQELGRGDFGVTCRAVDAEGGGGELALKIAHAHLRQDDLFLALLERECAPLSRLVHPGIASFQGLISESGQLVAAREMVAGESLRQVLARGRVPVEHVPGLLDLSLRALAHAHQQRVIHGDLSPENIFWCYDGSLRITDFGMARAVHLAESTRTGAPSGHPDTMAPEQAVGQISARSDLYSLALIAFECLVGHPACQPGDAQAKQGWHRYIGMTDPRVEQPECPDWLARLLLQLAAIEPSTRPKDAEAALLLLRPTRAPSVGGFASELGSQAATTPSGLVPPPPPERTPPAPPRLERPVPDDTLPTFAQDVLGAVGFGGDQGFGLGGAGTPSSGPAPGLVGTDPAPSPAPPASQASSEASVPVVGASRSPVSASARGVDRRLDPITPTEKAELARQERIRVTVFWSVAVGVLLVSTVAFVGYRAMEARRLAAARATGPDIDPELLVGGGFDRYGEPVEDEPVQGSPARLARPQEGGGSAQDPRAGVRDNAASQNPDERYLLGGGDPPTREEGSVTLTSNPIGARVWLDNTEVGHTPLEGYHLREGRHVVRLEYEGYAWLSQRIEVQRGVTLDLGTLALEREVVAAGPVLLWSVELEGASVFVDGTHAGRMPVVVEMTPGSHTFFVQPTHGEPVELELIAYPGTGEEPGRLQLEPR